MHFATWLLWAAVPVFLAVGVQGLLLPHRILHPLGAKLETPSLANEIRANYGGMHLGIAVLMALGALKPEFQLPALALLFTFTAGLCVGRTFSLVADGRPNRFTFVFWGLEAIGAVAAAAVLFFR